jgi:hypothetical protein
VAHDFGFWGHNNVDEQMRVTINQSAEYFRCASTQRFDRKHLQNALQIRDRQLYRGMADTSR